MSITFPKIFHLGAPELDRLWNGPVEVTEKIDGCVSPNTPILKADLSYVQAVSMRSRKT